MSTQTENPVHASPDVLGRGLLVSGTTSVTHDIPDLEHASISALASVKPGAVAVEAAYIAIDGSNEGFAESVIMRCRRHTDPGLYLKPLVLVTPRSGVNDELVRSVDVCCGWEGLNSFDEELWSGVGKLRDRVAMFEMDNHCDVDLGLKLLRFMASRETVFRPYQSIATRAGFTYPQLRPFLPRADASELELLGLLAERGYLEPEFSTRTYLCGRCHCAFLNFKEVCPHCSSPHLSNDDLVHHFRCGFTDTAAAFDLHGNAQCPKCELPLNQLGVDYDRPASIELCHACGYRFQEPRILASCFHCRHTAPPEDHIKRDVSQYTVTAFGEEVAIRTQGSRNITEAPSLGSAERISMFGTFIEAERSRARVAGAPAGYIAMLHPQWPADETDVAGRNSKLTLISKTICETKRQVDIHCELDDGYHLLLLTNCEINDAEALLAGLEAALSAALEKKISVRVIMHPLDEHFRLERWVLQCAGARPA